MSLSKYNYCKIFTGIQHELTWAILHTQLNPKYLYFHSFYYSTLTWPADTPVFTPSQSPDSAYTYLLSCSLYSHQPSSIKKALHLPSAIVYFAITAIYFCCCTMPVSSLFFLPPFVLFAWSCWPLPACWLCHLPFQQERWLVSAGLSLKQF